MFAQLFGAAKRAISRTPSYQGRSSEPAEEIPEVPTSDPALPQDAAADSATGTTDTDTAIAMVTTRRGTETPGMASTPASSAKKIGKRELDALETPTQVKRARKTTVEVKRTLRSTPRKGDAPPSAESTQEENSEEAEGDDDDNNTAGTSKTSPLAIRRRSSPQVVVEPSSPVAVKDDAPAADDGFHTPEPASSEANFVTPFTSKKALAGSPTPKASQETPAAAKKARGRPAKKTHKEDTSVPEEIPSSTQETTSTSPPAKAHVRFGSEEPTANLKGYTRYEAPAAASTSAATAQNDDDDSGSDSDEAPEMVSTSAAATKAAAAAADTSRALAAQTDKERKKREARLARIAEEQAAKRERDALKAKKAAARAAKAARLASVAEAADEDEDDTSMLDRSALPSLLPEDLLATLGDVRPPTPPPEARGKTEEELRREKLNHHIKFLEQSSKTPKDRRVGKHHVAVLGQQSKNMAAKVSRNTKGVREAWLKGRQGQKTQGKPRLGKTHRAKFGGGGFLRGED